MSTIRSLTGLLHDLSDREVAFLVDSDNRPALKEFLSQRTQAALPSEMTVGGRTYEILPILRGKEDSVRGNTMVTRAKEMQAHLGKEDGEHLLAHQGDIPVALRDKVVFAFPDWPRPDDHGGLTYVFWGGGCWASGWRWLDRDWDDADRVLRRRS